jgi:hypothetical protein
MAYTPEYDASDLSEATISGIGAFIVGALPFISIFVLLLIILLGVVMIRRIGKKR